MGGLEVDVPWGAFSDGQLAGYDAASRTLKGTDPKYRVALGVSSNFTGVGTSLTDIPGLTTNLPRAGTYWIDFNLVTNLNAPSQAIAAGVNLSANFTRCAVQVINATTVSNIILGVQTANNTAAGSGSRTTAATDLPVRLSGTVTVSGPATLTCRIQCAGNVLTVGAGSGGFIAEL